MAYRHGWLPIRDLPLPSVAIGNLTVGGSGKTPVAIWVAQHYVTQGLVRSWQVRSWSDSLHPERSTCFLPQLR